MGGVGGLDPPLGFGPRRVHMGSSPTLRPFARQIGGGGPCGDRWRGHLLLRPDAHRRQPIRGVCRGGPESVSHLECLAFRRGRCPTRRPRTESASSESSHDGDPPTTSLHRIRGSHRSLRVCDKRPRPQGSRTGMAAPKPPVHSRRLVLSHSRHRARRLVGL